MVFPNIPPELEAFFLMHSPEYQQGYQAGYEQAKAEMQEVSNKMKSLSESTATMTVEHQDNAAKLQINPLLGELATKKSSTVSATFESKTDMRGA